MTSRPPSVDSIPAKGEHIEEIERATQAEGTSKAQGTGHGDAALAILGTSGAVVHITPEEDAAVLRKIDRWLIPVRAFGNLTNPYN